MSLLIKRDIKLYRNAYTVIENNQNRLYTLGTNPPLMQGIYVRIQLKSIWNYYSIKTCVV